MAREPEANMEVFDLGHYEQAQIAVALGILIDAANWDKSFSFDPETLADLDVSTIANLVHIFGCGTVTIVRTTDKE